MIDRRYLQILIAILSLAALSLKAEEYAVTGVVRAVLSPQELVIAHDDIPGLMPAMTMAFNVDDPESAKAISVNDRIEGVLVVGNGPTRLTRLRKTGTGSDGGAQARSNAVVRLDEGDVVPAFDLVDQSNAPTTVAVADRPTLVTFIFTRCPIREFCPLMSERFALVQEAVQDRSIKPPLRLLSVTLDPEFDTPSVLQAYGGFYEADPAIWEFATGKPGEVEKVVRSFRVYRERNGALLDHTLCTALIDANGVVRKIWRGNGWTTDEVIAAVNALESNEVAQQ